jgi:hypothetical protein
MPDKNSITTQEYPSSWAKTEDDDVIDKAAEQLAVLLCKTWLHSKKEEKKDRKTALSGKYTHLV